MFYLLGAILAWGFSNLFMKLSLSKLDAVAALLGNASGAILCALFIGSLHFSSTTFFDKTGSFWAFLGGLSVSLGGYFFLKALTSMNLSFAITFSSLNVLVSALLGIFLLREILTPLQMLGGVAMIFGAMLLGFSEGK